MNSYFLTIFWDLANFWDLDDFSDFLAISTPQIILPPSPVSIPSLSKVNFSNGATVFSIEVIRAAILLKP